MESNTQVKYLILNLLVEMSCEDKYKLLQFAKICELKVKVVPCAHRELIWDRGGVGTRILNRVIKWW